MYQAVKFVFLVYFRKIFYLFNDYIEHLLCNKQCLGAENAL